MTERFTLLTELGRGGMGVVWKARDEETGQIVALKLLRETYAEDPDYITRFERELELARRIDSAHVVKVLGFGVRQKVPYLALEYVDGKSIREHLVGHGPYTWEETRPLLLQIVQGLADAHAAGVVHRDIKPSNVLVGNDGVAKIADFGIAKGLDLTRVTGTSTLLGTPAYLPPEGPADERSDLYSLGIIAFEFLAGVVPFEGRTYQDVILRHVREAPNLERLPAEARAIVGWLLAKDPAQRPQSADKLLRVLHGTGQIPVEPEVRTVAPAPQALSTSPPIAPSQPVAAPTYQPGRATGWALSAQPVRSNEHPILNSPASPRTVAAPVQTPPSDAAAAAASSERATRLARLGACLALGGAIAAGLSPWISWVDVESQGATSSTMGVNLGELTGNGAVGIDALFVAAMVAAFFALTTAAYAPTRGRRALAACTAVAGFVVLEAVWSAWRDLDLWISQQNVSSSHPAGLAVATAGGITILLGALIAALTPGQRSVGPASDRRPGP